MYQLTLAIIEGYFMQLLGSIILRNLLLSIVLKGWFA